MQNNNVPGALMHLDGIDDLGRTSGDRFRPPVTMSTMKRIIIAVCAMLAAWAMAYCSASAATDPRHDFDFESGRWKIAWRQLQHPLSASHVWIVKSGLVHIARPLWAGAALAQLEDEQPRPHFLGLMVHLYDEQSHQWKVYWGDGSSGDMDPPLIGGFKNGRGEFLGHDTIGGKPVLVRVEYSRITASSFRAEQFLSADDGKSWEATLIQDFSRQ